MGKNKKSNKISDHFSIRDFYCRCGKCDHAYKISLGLVGGLEFLRYKLKNRVYIVKGYVCPEAAEQLRESKRTFHTFGIAAEITVENKSAKDVFLAAETVPEFRGVGLNLKDNTVHVDTRKEKEQEYWIIDGERRIELNEETRKKYFEYLSADS